MSLSTAVWQKSQEFIQFWGHVILGSGRKRRVWHIYNEREDTLRLSRVPCDTLYRLGMRLLRLVWARRLRDLPGQFPYVITLTLLSKVAWLEPRIRQPLAFLWIEVYSMVQSKHCHQFESWLFHSLTCSNGESGTGIVSSDTLVYTCGSDTTTFVRDCPSGMCP